MKNPFNSMSSEDTVPYAELEDQPGSPEKASGKRVFPCGCKLTFYFLLGGNGERFNESTDKEYCYIHKRERIQRRISLLRKKLREERRKLADLEAVQKISAILHGDADPIAINE